MELLTNNEQAIGFLKAFTLMEMGENCTISVEAVGAKYLEQLPSEQYAEITAMLEALEVAHTL